MTALEFHHRDPATKSFEICMHMLRRWDLLVAEAKKCDLLCSNCHRELEEGLRRADEGDEGAE